LKRKKKSNAGNPSARYAASDALGLQSLGQRLRALPQQAIEYLQQPFSLSKRQRLSIGRDLVLCGTGSSLAHAYYLQHLLQAAPALRVRVLTLSAFLDLPASTSFKRSCLVVLSQGLSPNAQLALRARKQFASCVLFTAATPSGQKAAGRPERVALLEQLARERALIVPFPVENEYETLLRVTGPFSGYLACYRFASSLTRGVKQVQLPELQASDLLSALARAQNAGARASLQGLAKGVQIICSAQLAAYAQNLEYKFIEGALLANTSLCDVLAYAHGPFQRAVAQRSPALCLDLSPAILGRVKQMQRRAKLPCISYHAQLPEALRVLEYEAFLNALLLKVMQRRKTNQRHWPGQGWDRPLYQLDRPLRGS
jgi:fructoselysine-6-P-deglycase FrlB-like protein